MISRSCARWTRVASERPVRSLLIVNHSVGLCWQAGTLFTFLPRNFCNGRYYLYNIPPNFNITIYSYTQRHTHTHAHSRALTHVRHRAWRAALVKNNVTIAKRRECYLPALLDGAKRSKNVRCATTTTITAIFTTITTRYARAVYVVKPRCFFLSVAISLRYIHALDAWSCIADGKWRAPSSASSNTPEIWYPPMNLKLIDFLPLAGISRWLYPA